MIRDGAVSRDIVNGRLNLDLPITSKRRDVLAFAGDLSANANVSVDHLSDFGTLTTIGYGANWGPFDALRVQVSFDDAERAPSATQLGDPTISPPNNRPFDYVRGQTVAINRIAGDRKNFGEGRNGAEIGNT